MLSVPGLQVKFDPEEAEQGKAFMAIAQSEEDAARCLGADSLTEGEFHTLFKLDMRNSIQGLRTIYIVINVKANIILGQITTAPNRSATVRGGGYYLFWLILMDNFISADTIYQMIIHKSCGLQVGITDGRSKNLKHVFMSCSWRLIQVEAWISLSVLGW